MQKQRAAIPVDETSQSPTVKNRFKKKPQMVFANKIVKTRTDM